MNDSSDIVTRWNLACASARNHASSIAAQCRREAKAMIHRETDVFCDREPPVTEAELKRRQQQATYLASKIGSISHADLMARIHPAVSDQIMEAVKEFLRRVGIEDPPDKESTALISTISSICHSDILQHR